MAIRSEPAFLFFQYSYTFFLYTTPYIVYSILLSGLYIFALKTGRKIRAGKLPIYSDPRKRRELSLVLGEVHHPRKQMPSETPRWLVIPERGLFTGIAIVAVGSGKTASCMYPFAEQILAYRAEDRDRRIGGLILEVKGDFCGKVQEILARHGRAGDYVEISLDSEYRYNPLHNDLDAYALAYNIASLLNNLFGRGKEPLLAAGLHQPGDIHHPAAQGRFRLRYPLRCLPEFQAWLRYKNANGSDIYLGQNPLRQDASTRTKGRHRIHPACLSRLGSRRVGGPGSG
jgi:hypothetical protein